MNIVFKKIILKNFLQVGDFPVEFDLNKNNFTVIVGKNGSGKSTILDAITYVLFKKPFRKVKLSQLINCTNKKNMVVEIEFDIGSDSYRVVRGEKPKVFEIYKNGQLIEIDDSINNYQNLLETQIIRQSFKTFTQINTIGKASYVQFMSLDPASRRQIIEDILDVGTFDKMAVLCKEDIKSLKLEISQKERDLDVLKTKISTTQEALDSFENKKKENIFRFQRRNEETQKRKAELESEIKKMEDEISLLKTKEIFPANDVKRLNEYLRKFQVDYGVLKTEIEKSSSLIEKINDMEICPHCLQKVDETHRKEILSLNQREVEEKSEKLDLVKQKILKLKKVSEDFENHNSIIYQKESSLGLTKREISDMEREISRNLEQISEIQSQKLDNLPDIKFLKTEGKNLYDCLNAEGGLREKLALLGVTLKLLSDGGLKSLMIENYIGKINQYINHYLEKMQMFVEFELDGEFNESIRCINRDSFTYESFSEGQKLRIDLSILLTWRKIAMLKNSMHSNIFILDEIADASLDEEGFVDFIEILKTSFPDNNVFLISHKDSIIDLFENSIRVETRGNFSEYEFNV